MLVIVRNTQCLDGYRSLMLRRHRLRVLFMNRFFAFLTHTNKSTSSFMLFSNWLSFMELCQQVWLVSKSKFWEKWRGWTHLAAPDNLFLKLKQDEDIQFVWDPVAVDVVQGWHQSFTRFIWNAGLNADLVFTAKSSRVLMQGVYNSWKSWKSPGVLLMLLENFIVS